MTPILMGARSSAQAKGLMANVRAAETIPSPPRRLRIKVNGACAQAGSENAVTSAANSKVVGRVIGAPLQVAPNLDFAATFEIFSD